MVYEESLKAGLRFPLDMFFIDVFHFQKFLIAQLHLNGWRILVVFHFVCFNNNIELSVALFSQFYQLGTRKNEEFWFFSGKKCHALFDRIPSSLKRWKNKLFILRHRVFEGFGQLHTSWNIHVELRKDGVPP